MDKQVYKQIEVCVICGFVHRDDRDGYRASKFHHHWLLPPVHVTAGQLKDDRAESHARMGIHGEYMLPPTVCSACLVAVTGEPIWTLVERGLARTPEQYRLNRFNFTMPDVSADAMTRLNWHYRKMMSVYGLNMMSPIKPDAKID